MTKRVFYTVQINGSKLTALLTPERAARYPGAQPVEFDPNSRLAELIATFARDGQLEQAHDLTAEIPRTEV
jgi:hypothetical protein